jgi:hypothetical protein
VYDVKNARDEAALDFDERPSFVVGFPSYSGGEWGGGLWACAPGSHPTRLEPVDDLPVVGVVPSTGGELYIGTGLAHLASTEANVGVHRTNGTWTTLARSSQRPRSSPIGWNLEPDSAEAIALDSAGRLYVLTGSQGVARVEGGKLWPVTPGWPRHQHVYGEGLLIDGEQAVIATFDGGVLSWTLGTEKVRRIPLR